MPRYSHRSRTRRRNRGRFGPLFKLLCVAAVGVAMTVGATVFFRVEQVSVSGNQRYTQEEIVAASGIELGDNLYALNKVRISRDICAALPYIEKLSIKRLLPNTIAITVTEWEAVAQLAVPDPERAAQLQQEAVEAAGDSSDVPEVKTAREPWLISVKASLLEPAPADSRAILVTGLTPLDPKAGSKVEVPEEEEPRLTALVSLLEALAQAEMMGQVSDLRLDATQLTMRYLDRFDVKLKLNADFPYDLRRMQAVREWVDGELGETAAGSMDLTQARAAFSPAE